MRTQSSNRGLSLFAFGLTTLALACSGAEGGDGALFTPPVSDGPTSETSPSPSPRPSPSPAQPDGPTVVAVDSGKVRGAHVGAMLTWKGIPYAAPPVGANRWREPQPVAPWAGVREATEFGPKCVQTAPDTSEATGGSEDCLTVNVWRPDGEAPPGGFPVMVFVHGGYNVRGSSSEEIEPGQLSYDPKALVARGVVFVSLNYRVGALGWMAHSALSAESGRGSGNYGALDQLSALSWVQRNARVFGADPKRVLVFGQSAGATNTCILFASPLSKTLFSRAIMHSGTCPAVPLERAEEAGATLTDRLGCAGAKDVLACMRAKPAAEVASAMTLKFTVGGFSWGPVVDGRVLPASPGALVASGMHNHVPILIGSTAHEMTTLWATALPKVPVPKTPEEHEGALRTVFGPTYADRILEQYPASAYSSPAMASVAAMTDPYFTCPTREIARGVAAAQSEPVRRFYFSHVARSGPLRAYGAGHGFDLLFTLALPVSFFTPTPGEIALSDAMIGYWTRFAATGDPNGAGATAWPPYDAEADTHLVLDEAITLGTRLREPQCDFWRELR